MGYTQKYYLHHKDKILKYNRPYSLKSYYNKKFGGKRGKILRRDNYCCRKCSLTQLQHFSKYKRDITVDHIDKNKNNNFDSNLITLCLKCHSSKDRRLTVEKKKLILKNKILIVLTKKPLSGRKIGSKIGVSHTPAIRYLLELKAEGKVLQVPYFARKYWIKGTKKNA